MADQLSMTSCSRLKLRRRDKIDGCSLNQNPDVALLLLLRVRLRKEEKLREQEQRLKEKEEKLKEGLQTNR